MFLLTLFHDVCDKSKPKITKKTQVTEEIFCTEALNSHVVILLHIILSVLFGFGIIFLRFREKQASFPEIKSPDVMW